MSARKVLAAFAVLAGANVASAQTAPAPRDTAHVARVLMIAAHPDDEDTRLLAWLAKGQHVETAYLSLTRGDGGQNLIGNELGDALGVIRTEELLAARRLDGAHQYFTRAYDFGFSKTAAESFSHWPHDSLLGDVVTVVRAFRPDIIVSVFSGTPIDGHGQHQVSGILAREAYDDASDTVRFPVAKYGAAWIPLKFYRDRSYFGKCDSCLVIPIDSVFAALAVESRHQHKSQGFGTIAMPTANVSAYLLREGTRVDSTTPRTKETSLFEGLNRRVSADTVTPFVVRPDTVIVSDTLVTQPWWLVTPRQGDMFTVSVSRVPEDEIDQHVVFVPPVSITLDQSVMYIRAGVWGHRMVDVAFRNNLNDSTTVQVTLKAPAALLSYGQRPGVLNAHVTIPAHGVSHIKVGLAGRLPAGQDTVSVSAELNGRVYSRGYVSIAYPHIRTQNLYQPARMTLVSVDVNVPKNLTVAYIPGVGDNVAPALKALGIPVTIVDSAAIATTDFSRYHTVVVGTRAYEADSLLVMHNARLLDYVRDGGTLVVQYGQYEMTNPGMMPYAITLARPADRVTVETVPVRILDPKAIVLNTPNTITDADFDGWVQERSLYMPHTFDSTYHTVLSMNDPGEPANDAGILMTQLGKGTYIYTTLSFFRQLPAGNPGAARLFVNLLSAEGACCDVR